MPGSWYVLLDVVKEARQWAAEDASAQPVACPNDGEPLLESDSGVLFCKYDGYRPKKAGM